MQRFALPACLLLLLAAPLTAQQPAMAPSCLSEWGCSGIPQPLGLYVNAVDEGGRYITLEDGSVWEVEISDRATTASWGADDFVNLDLIGAPRGEYEYRLSRVGQAEQHAAARLAGRRPPAFRTSDTAPEQRQE